MRDLVARDASCRPGAESTPATNGSNWFAVSDGLDAGLRRASSGVSLCPVQCSRARSASRTNSISVRSVARHQHEDRVLLVEPGEVEQVAVLPILVVDVERIDRGGALQKIAIDAGSELIHRFGPTLLEVVLKGAGGGHPGREQGTPRETHENERLLGHGGQILQQLGPQPANGAAPGVALLAGRAGPFAGKGGKPEGQPRILSL